MTSHFITMKKAPAVKPGQKELLDDVGSITERSEAQV
jgi:hypothetical protein